MKLIKDEWGDLVSDDFNSNDVYILYPEFRKRDWGYYYYNSSYELIKKHKERYDNNKITINKYYL